MGVIWTSKTRTTQPQTLTGVDWGNPLSRSLAVLVSGASPGYNSAKQAPVITTNSPTISGTSKGLGISWPSTTSPGVHVGAGSLLKGSAGNYTSGLTLAVYANPSASSTRFLPMAMSDNATQPQCYLIFNGDKALSATSGMFAFQTQGATGAQAAGVIDGKWHLFAVVFPEGTTTPVLYVDGVDVTASATPPPSGYGADIQDVYVGGYSSGSWAVSGFSLALSFGFNRGLSAREVKALSDNPWQLFAPEKRPLFFSTGGGANTTGTLAATLDAATLTGVGGVARSGTLATTLDAATLTGVGNVTRSGTLAVTLDAATLSGTGAVTRSGTSAVTLGDVTLAGVGSVAVGTNRDGTLAVTLDAATLAGVGAVTRSGTLAVTLDAATLAGVGTAGQAITGTLGVALGNVTLAGIGAIPAAPSAGGGKTFGSNKKKKKQRKAIESEEWLKAEETAKQLLQDRFTKTTPEAKLEALATHIESLQPVIDALKALATDGVQEPVQETRTEELTEHQQVLNKFDALITKMSSIEELLIIMMAQ